MTRNDAKLTLNIPVLEAPLYHSWPEQWDAAAPLLQAKRQILILDEQLYAAEASSAKLSPLQYAWDYTFRSQNWCAV